MGGVGIFSSRPAPVPPGPGQESAWDYPRPPRLEAVARTPRRGARRRGDRGHDARLARARDEPPAELLLPARRRTRRRRRTRARATSFCEFKGRAAYFTVRGGDARRTGTPPGATTSPAPRSQPLTGYLAFYAEPDGCLLRRTASSSCPRRAASTAGGSRRGSSARSRARPARAAGKSRRAQACRPVPSAPWPPRSRSCCSTT